MKLRLVVLLALFVAIGAAIGYGIFVWPKDRAKDAVRLLLKDPDSAKFRDVQHNRRTGTSCGLVNAKNSMGGYVGERAFLVQAGGSMASLAPDPPSSYDNDEEKLRKLLLARRFNVELREQCFGEKTPPLEREQCPPEVPGCSWGQK